MKRNKCFALVAMLALSLGAYAPEAAAAGTKIKTCQTITNSGSYELQNNLTASGSCLVVQADFVTIDLNGFTITGDGTGRGILGSSQDGVTVRNGTIINFIDGIFLKNQAHVEGVHADSNDNNGIFVGSFSIVTGSTATNNGNRGIATAPGSIVTGNTANFNGSGINVGALSIVRGNAVAFNDSTGIATGEGAIVIGNNASTNGIGPAFGDRGIVVGFGSTVLQNTAVNNVGLGLLCSPTGGTPAGFANNVLTGNNGGNANPQEANCTSIGTNLCGTNTTCP